MTHRVPRANDREFWSNRDQALHRGEGAAHEEEPPAPDPSDYSAIGGPEDERAYGRSRGETGDYPFGRDEGDADRDSYGSHCNRGGYLKRPGGGLGNRPGLDCNADGTVKRPEGAVGDQSSPGGAALDKLPH